jgi:hypothetical protein
MNQLGRRQGEPQYEEPTTICEICLQNRTSEWHYPMIRSYPVKFAKWPIVTATDKKAHPRRCNECAK